jgi:hypothetical protein
MFFSQSLSPSRENLLGVERPAAPRRYVIWTLPGDKTYVTLPGSYVPRLVN